MNPVLNASMLSSVASPKTSASSAMSPTHGGSKRPSMSRGFRDAASLLSDSFTGPPSDEAVKVLCRVRPFNSREEQIHEQSIEGKPQWDQMPLRSIVEFRGNTCILHEASEWQERERFTFDGCLWSIPTHVQDSDNEFVSQETLFDLYGRDLLSEVWKGFNTCFFAYGQTGSGKTYSMMGDDDNPGFIPRLGQCLFDQIEEVLLEAEQGEGQESFHRQFRVEVRYMEIYNEMIKDLLWPLSPLPPEMKAKLNPENLKIRSTTATGVFIEGLTGVEVNSWKRMAELIELGNVARSVASTKMNERSSRSHAVFKITLSQMTTSVPRKQFEKPTQHLRSAQINLVDLAGSERNKKTGATGDRLKEAASINRSLMCLKQVIDALVDNSQITRAANKKRVPYRDSHLTAVLMDSLGGNAKTWMLVCVSPHSDNAEETQQTLRYGSRARKILNTVHVNENASARLMLDLEDELERLKAELASSTEAATPEAVDSLKAQIDAHESAISSLEGEVEAQKQSIELLQVEKERNTKARHAGAIANLTIVMQARLSRDAVQEDLQRSRDEFAALQEQLIKAQSETTSCEAEIARSSEEAKRLRQGAAALDHSVEDMKKKISKLESQRRALQKSLDEGESLVKSLSQDKFATILRARLAVARIRIEFRRKLEELRANTAKKLDDMRDAAARKERAEDEEVQTNLGEQHQRIMSLRNHLAAAKQEEEKLEAEKTSQIATLQSEVAHLQQDLRRKKEHHSSKLAQIAVDWDKKMGLMVSDMERQLLAIDAEWQRKRQEMEDQRDYQKRTMLAEFESKTNFIQNESMARLKAAAEQGEEACRRLEDEWGSILSEKQSVNDALRERLREIAAENQKYCELQYQVATSMDLLQKVKLSRKASPEAKAYAADALLFHALFEEYHPEKSKLEHLIKANLTLKRCTVAPILGEGAAVRSKSASARSQSPIIARGSCMQGRSLSRGASMAGSSPSLHRLEDSVGDNAGSPKVLRSISPRVGVDGGRVAIRFQSGGASPSARRAVS